jgi:hypothetical protein
MGYIINRYNGQVLTTVEDGTVNLTTEVKFVGRNFAGYGENQNENFLHLMENFANPTPPGKPLSGMIWYDSTVNKIKFYDGVRWRTTGSAEVSSTQPIGNVEGDFWWNSNTNQLYTRSGNGEWVLVGPQTTALGTTQFVSREVLDTANVSRSIIEAVLSDGVTEFTPLIIAESDFTIAPGEIDDANFTASVIKKGITLADTNANGISTNSVLWGTASNALRLGGFLPSSFIRTDDLNFTDPLTVNSILRLSTDQFSGVIQNISDQTLKFVVRGNNIDETILTINLTGLIPGKNSTYDIGTSSLAWKNIYANRLIGTADRADTLKVGSDYKTANFSFSSSNLGEVVARTPTAQGSVPANSIRAVQFVGVATQAQYADLAEKYTTNREWPVGTAMAVCDHKDHETGPANSSSIAIGVISANPAYLMNSESEGQAIALKGRVPVRVIGPVHKGQAVYAWNDGVCSTVATNALIGVALESNSSEEEKLVECVLKV